tara:strand:+ start:188 stop:874 length:687 start_codon:yes stop_codon:yes gene_type:complete
MTQNVIKVFTVLFLFSGFFVSCSEKVQELRSPSGGYQEISFNNGTEVKLGPDSKASYSLSSSEMVLEGEAVLNVTPGRSFKISTPNGIVSTETGEYRIHSRRTTMNVFVISGKANTSNIDGGAAKELTDKMYAIYNGKNLADANTKAVEQMTNDKYWVFNSASIKFVLECIAAQYGISFEEGDAKLNKVFSGFVPRDDLQIALSIVTRSLSLEYQEDGSRYLLSNATY